jgi:hypothetical protein
MALQFHPLHPLFDAEVGAIDLRRVEDRATLDEIRAGMDKYAVLVFRDQPFTDAEQLAFVQRFDGRLHAKTGSSVLGKNRLGNEALTDISNLDEAGAIMQAEDRRRAYGLGLAQGPDEALHGLVAPGVPVVLGELLVEHLRRVVHLRGPGCEKRAVVGQQGLGAAGPVSHPRAPRHLPLGLAHMKLTRSVAKGQLVSWADVEVEAKDPIVALRREMEKAFAPK